MTNSNNPLGKELADLFKENAHVYGYGNSTPVEVVEQFLPRINDSSYHACKDIIEKLEKVLNWNFRDMPTIVSIVPSKDMDDLTISVKRKNKFRKSGEVVPSYLTQISIKDFMKLYEEACQFAQEEQFIMKNTKKIQPSYYIQYFLNMTSDSHWRFSIHAPIGTEYNRLGDNDHAEGIAAIKNLLVEKLKISDLNIKFVTDESDPRFIVLIPRAEIAKSVELIQKAKLTVTDEKSQPTATGDEKNQQTSAPKPKGKKPRYFTFSNKHISDSEANTAIFPPRSPRKK